ncbi:MAG: hypothetical protein NZ481_09480, partial [Candidatus Kapabacteria bacterium]|nr:hypothetical protein [Candidatus Kapabacteria bacterium]
WADRCNQADATDQISPEVFPFPGCGAQTLAVPRFFFAQPIPQRYTEAIPTAGRAHPWDQMVYFRSLESNMPNGRFHHLL